MIKLDYSLQTPEERNNLVKKILEENPNPSEKYLEILADYLVLCMEKQEKKEKKLLTDNRMVTVMKRECSFEGLVSQLENGEDGIYNLMAEKGNKNIIFQPKKSITKKDVAEIPELRQLRQAIEGWESKLKTATGRNAFIIKQTIIELRKDQYIIKNSFRCPITPNKIIQSKPKHYLDEKVSLDKNGYVVAEGVSLMNPKVCSALLCNYSKLKQDAWGDFENEMWFLLEDFDNITTVALKDNPIFEKIVLYKIDGLSNLEIQKKIQEEFGTTYTVEHISSLWRNKIPKMIASAAEDDYLYNYYYLLVEKGKYKRCSRCGEIKLAHNKYFSKNKGAKDGFYSICKKCRNSKQKHSI